jgi:3-isopropylmalate/(R)-2-methylmalate dehydratase small subunit
MAGFREHIGKTAVYYEHNVDTDRIIPARFLSMVTRSGYGEHLFADVRGETFPLDQPEAQGATVLVVGRNFGSGSSREHAVWAMQQAGFVAVVAEADEGSPGFSDIFRQNAANCGLLLIELPPNEHRKLVTAGSGQPIRILVEEARIEFGGENIPFDIPEAMKRQIMEGLDLIGLTLQYEDEIAAYERADRTPRPAKVTPK